MPDISSTLTAAGMHPAEAAAKSSLFAACLAALPNAHAAFWVPGRIEFLGKHTDYAGGRSLICAAEQGFALAVRPRTDHTITLTDPKSNNHAEFPLSPDLTPTAGHWSNYPMTVARRVARNFGPNLKGADIAFTSDLPPASGMSSSSAFIVATFLALSHANSLPERPEYRAHIKSNEDLGGYLGTIENGQSFGPLTGDRGVGTFGGSEDHTAILCSTANHVAQYAYCPVTPETIAPLPKDHIFVIASSGVLAEKTGAAMEKYNRVSLLVSEILRLWRDSTNRTDPTLAAAARSSPDAPDRLREILRTRPSPARYSSHELLDRFEQFFVESEHIIPAATAALRSGDLPDLAAQVARSQYMAERLLHNQTPETIFLARSATDLGATAASAFGAGFGGSVWALVKESDAPAFTKQWSAAYTATHPTPAERARFFPTRSGPPARRVL